MSDFFHHCLGMLRTNSSVGCLQDLNARHHHNQIWRLDLYRQECFSFYEPIRSGGLDLRKCNGLTGNLPDTRDNHSGYPLAVCWRVVAWQFEGNSQVSNWFQILRYRGNLSPWWQIDSKLRHQVIALLGIYGVWDTFFDPPRLFAGTRPFDSL